MSLSGHLTRFFLHRNAAEATRRLWSKLCVHTSLVNPDESYGFPVKTLISYPPRVQAREKCRKVKRMKDKPEISKEKQKLLFRIKRIRGQFAAVERALEAGDECADLLMLLAAIRGGVNGLMAEVLEDHIRLHMMTPDHEMDSPEELGEDLIGLVRAYLK